MTMEMVTRTGCKVIIKERHDFLLAEGVYLQLAVDTRFAELKMTPAEARRIGQALIEQAYELDMNKMGQR